MIRQGLGAAPARRRSSSPITTRPTPPARSSRARSTRRRSSRSTASASGARRRCGVGRGQPDRADARRSQFPHSLGLLYSAFTYYCGFKVNSGEYKLMGLAPYGEPVYEDLILEHLIDLKADGSFRLDMEYFNYCQGLTMTSRAVRRAVRRAAARAGVADRAAGDGPGRQHPGGDRGDRCCAIGRAAVHAQTGHEEPRAGRRRGAQLRRQRPAPARGAVRRHLDSAGGRRRRRRARRGALRLASAAREAAHRRRPRTRQQGSFLGPALHDRRDLRRSSTASGAHVPARSTTRPSCSSASPELLADEQGRRLVPGADGVRPARARRAQHPRRPAVAEDAGDDEPQDQVPRDLPAVRAVRAAGARRTSGSRSSRGRRARTCCWSRRCCDEHRVPDHRRRSARRWRTIPDLRNRVNVAAVDDPGRHARRLQRAGADGRRRRATRDWPALLRAFERRTGCPVLVNTSFNVRGEPIVCTPEDAYRCFLGTDMDVLVLEDVDPAEGRRRRERCDAATRETIPGAVPVGLSGGTIACHGASPGLTRPDNRKDNMQWSDVTKPPSPKMLRQFAGLWLVVFGGLAAWRAWQRAGRRLDAWRWPSPRVVVGGSAWRGRRPMRPIYTGWMIAAFPIGWTISRLVLGGMFYLRVHAGGARLPADGPRCAAPAATAAGVHTGCRSPARSGDEYFRQF